MTSLEQATMRVLAAIEEKNFEQLDEVMKERAKLLSAGAEITPRAWELGEEARRALTTLKQDLLLDSSRLEQVRKLAEPLPSRPTRHMEYFG